MNVRKPFGGLVCLVLALSAAPMIFAQGPNGGGAPFPPRPMGRGFGFAAPVTGAPFSATRTVTHVETLADGTTITHSSTINEARDSSGRTYSASTSTGPNGSSVTSYHVLDPVSHVSIIWNSNSKQAHVMNLPTSSQSHGRGPADGGQGSGTPNARGGGPRGNGGETTVEDLGAEDIAGVSAEGKLTTRTIPAGKIGNSEPLVSTVETWRSSTLKIVLEQIDTNPREGTTTDQVTTLNQNEPAESLFQVPAGYTTVTVPARGPRP